MYNGPERRSSMQSDDHDILIEIRQDLKNFMVNFDKHVTEDSKLAGKVDTHAKIIYGCLGAFALIEFLLKIFK